MTTFPFTVSIANTSQIDLPHPVFDQPVDSLFLLSYLDFPVTGKIVHHAVRYYSQGNLIAHLLRNLHQTVYRIVQCRVTAHDDNGLVTIIDHHVHQTFHTIGILALHLIEHHPFLVQDLLDPLPPFLWTEDVTFRTVENSPTAVCLVIRHISLLFGLFL